MTLIAAIDITDVFQNMMTRDGEQVTGESGFHCAICDAEMYTANSINGQFVMSAGNLHYIMGATITHVVDTHGALMAEHTLWETGIDSEEYARRLDAIREEACKVPMRGCKTRHEGVCGDEENGDPAVAPETVGARS